LIAWPLLLAQVWSEDVPDWQAGQRKKQYFWKEARHDLPRQYIDPDGL